MPSDIHTIELPLIIDAEDYHDFSYIAEIASKLTGTPISVDEVGHSDETGRYLGVVYAEVKPSPEEISVLIAGKPAAPAF